VLPFSEFRQYSHFLPDALRVDFHCWQILSMEIFGNLPTFMINILGVELQHTVQMPHNERVNIY
jgi:hypothetical protein